MPLLPTPFSPVQSARKFSTVFGTVFPYSPIVMRPAGAPSIDTSKKTLFVTLGPAAEARATNASRRNRVSISASQRRRSIKRVTCPPGQPRSPRLESWHSELALDPKAY